MFVPKGFRAREAAALQRSRRGLVAKEIRDQRHSVISKQIDAQIAAEQDAEPTNSQPTEPVKTEATQVAGDEGQGESIVADAGTDAGEAESQAKAKPNKKKAGK
jgi:hypothetical protein